MIRINKYLASTGICSRRQADELIKNLKVTINGKTAKLGDQVEGKEKIEVNGKPVKPVEQKLYIAFHKPYGVICTTDPNADNNIIDYLKFSTRIFPIGQLDVESSGLVLLANDGEIANRISKTAKNFEKEYIVTVDKPMAPAALQQLADGVIVLGEKTLPAKVQKIAPNQFSITTVQGMSRLIRQMCETIGYKIKTLKRIRINNITLEGLAQGKWRYISAEEITTLLK